MRSSAVLAFGIAAALGIAAAAPRRTWWAVRSWQFRNPEAVEPSEGAYTLSAVLSGVSAFVAFGFGVSLWDQSSPAGVAERFAQERASEAAEVARIESRCEEVLSALDEVYTGRSDELAELKRRAVELDVRIEPVVLATAGPDAPGADHEMWVFDERDGGDLIGTVPAPEPARQRCRSDAGP